MSVARNRQVGWIFAVLITVGLAGCRGKANAAADDQILWDSRGCAFYVRPHVGDTSIVRRLKGGDRPRCAAAVPQEAAHG